MGRSKRARSVNIPSYEESQLTRREKRLQMRLQQQSNNVVSIHQPQSKKHFHIKDLKNLSPLTENQGYAFLDWKKGQNLVLDGYSGTGKTTLALFFALQEVLGNGEQNKIVIIRSTAQGREMGFLPGTKEEKEAPFETPYVQVCKKLFSWSNSYNDLKELGIIEFESTACLRGTTFEDAIIIVDEIQNMTEQEAETVVTRVGEGSRVIFCGDDCQNDIGKVSGFNKIVPILKSMASVSFIDFELEDIVRSGFVREFLMAKYSK